MRHQRQGWWRLVALPVALLGALVIAPGLASASPNSVGTTTMDITDCKLTLVVDWSAQPGKLKTYRVEVWSDANTSVTTLALGDFARSGHQVLAMDLATFADSNTFHAVTRVFDGKGVEQDAWPSGDVARTCI